MKEQLKDTCLYFHIAHNQIFYVGIGNEKRPYDKGQRNKFWSHIVKKYGYEVDIYKTGLTWKEACQLEIEWIDKIGRRDLGKGPLVNMTDGGEGAYGVIHSKERNDKISKKQKGNNYNLGSKRTEEQRKNMSEGQKKWKRKPITEKARKALSEGHLKNPTKYWKDKKQPIEVNKKRSETMKKRRAENPNWSTKKKEIIT